MYKYSDNISTVHLGAASLVGAMTQALENHDVLIELDSDKFTAYMVETTHNAHLVRAPSMMDAEMYVAHALMECVTGVWEADADDEGVEVFFSATELLEAFRD